MIRLIKNTLSRIVKSYFRYRSYTFYASQFKRYIKKQGFENRKTVGENEYVAKWNAICSRVEPYSYRFFRHYVGDTPNIIPEDIGHSYIEEALNPPVFRKVYSDKNLFPKIVGEEYVPRTIICRINNSCLLDANFQEANEDLYHYITNAEKLILKPSLGACSGRGILLFHKEDGQFFSHDKSVVLSKEFLLSYGANFCLQEAVRQHDFFAQFCPTSVNTIRLCLYRSVVDEKSHVTASIVRIGKTGSYVDNAHAGGMFVGVDLPTGMFGKLVMDQYGNKKSCWNGIDFSSSTYVIPNWQDIIEFAEFVGTRLPHHHLIALDIALNRAGKPILIEYNIEGFGFWVFMLTGQEVLGGYTDEVIAYCCNHK